jgi:hypothetical protein
MRSAAWEAVRMFECLLDYAKREGRARVLSIHVRTHDMGGEDA